MRNPLCWLGIHSVRCRGRRDHTVIDGRTVLRTRKVAAREFEARMAQLAVDLAAFTGEPVEAVRRVLDAAATDDFEPLRPEWARGSDLGG